MSVILHSEQSHIRHGTTSYRPAVRILLNQSNVHWKLPEIRLEYFLRSLKAEDN